MVILTHSSSTKKLKHINYATSTLNDRVRTISSKLSNMQLLGLADTNTQYQYNLIHIAAVYLYFSKYTCIQH